MTLDGNHAHADDDAYPTAAPDRTPRWRYGVTSGVLAGTAVALVWAACQLITGGWPARLLVIPAVGLAALCAALSVVGIARLRNRGADDA